MIKPKQHPAWIVVLTFLLTGCGSLLQAGTQPLGAQDLDRISIADVALPQDLVWLHCPGGSNQVEPLIVNSPGGSVALRTGQLLHVTPGAVARPTAFLLHEPPAEQVVVEVETERRLAAGGAHLTLSWANRPRCDIEPGDNLVIVQIRDDGSFDVLKTIIDWSRRSVMTEEPIHDFSTFAIAH